MFSYDRLLWSLFTRQDSISALETSPWLTQLLFSSSSGPTPRGQCPLLNQITIYLQYKVKHVRPEECFDENGAGHQALMISGHSPEPMW